MFDLNLPTNCLTPEAKAAWAKVGTSLKKVKLWYRKFVRDPKTKEPFYTDEQVVEMMKWAFKQMKNNTPDYQDMLFPQTSMLEKVMLLSKGSKTIIQE